MSFNINSGLHLQQSRQQREFLDLPVDEKGILFVNTTWNAASGDLRALLSYCLQRQDLSDYTLFWDVHALDDLSSIPRSLIQTGRVQVVAHDAYEYRRALATCKYIITTNRLPYQFVKRPEQYLIYLPTVGVYWSELVATRVLLQSMTPLLDAVDLVVIPDDQMLDFLSYHRSPACTRPLNYLQLPHPRSDESDNVSQKPAKARVVVSLSKKLFNKYWQEKPDRLFDWASRMSTYWQINPEELCLLVPGKAMDWISDGYVSAPIQLATFANGLFPQLEGAQVLLTNSVYDLGVGLERGVTCVHLRAVSDTIFDLAAFSPYDRDYFVAETFNDAQDIVRNILLSNTPQRSPHSDVESSTKACEAIIDTMLGKR